MDPASLLVTSHFNDYMPQLPADWEALEYHEDDILKLAEVARSSSGISTLHEATNGDPTISARWHRYLELGAYQELMASLRSKSGKVWGALSMYREPRRPLFDSDDLRFIQAVTPHLAYGARRALLVDQAISAEYHDGPGLVVVSESWEVESTTPGMERWLWELPDGDWYAGNPRTPTYRRRSPSHGCSHERAPRSYCTAPAFSLLGLDRTNHACETTNGARSRQRR